MKKICFALLLLASGIFHLQAQTTSDAIKDSLREISLQATMSYPFIKNSVIINFARKNIFQSLFGALFNAGRMIIHAYLP